MGVAAPGGRAAVAEKAKAKTSNGLCCALRCDLSDDAVDAVVGSKRRGRSRSRSRSSSSSSSSSSGGDRRAKAADSFGSLPRPLMLVLVHNMTS